MKTDGLECPYCGKFETLIAVPWGYFCVACRSSKGATPEPAEPEAPST